MNLFSPFKQAALDSGHADNVDMNTETIKLLFLNGYDFNAAHRDVADVLAEAGTTEIGRSGALVNPTVLNGTFDADDNTTSGIAGGSTITDVVVYSDAGATDADKIVIAHIDEDQSAVPLSLVTDGSPITASFHASGIFDL